MTSAYRVSYADMPDSIVIPENFRHKRVELTLLSRDDDTPDEWPSGFLEETAGSIPDLERGEQGAIEERESL